MLEGFCFLLDSGIDRGQCFEVRIGCVALMECQQGIYPQLIVTLPIICLVVQLSLDRLVLGIREIHQQSLYLGESKGLIEAQLVCLWDILQCIIAHFLLEELVFLCILMKVFQVLHYQSPILNGLHFPIMKDYLPLLDCLLSMTYGLLGLRWFKPTYDSLRLSSMIIAFKNGLFLIPDSEDVCKGIFLLLREELMIFLNIKGRLWQQFIHFRLLTSLQLRLHLISFHTLDYHFLLNWKPFLSMIHSLQKRIIQPLSNCSLLILNQSSADQILVKSYCPLSLTASTLFKTSSFRSSSLSSVCSSMTSPWSSPSF